ncbi:MAG: type II toxin-antitoxin system RelE/ParE family toxin [Caulobacteraceae bacterium]|nr:type II toxin-antitoxin system RelE/ParE family toxin [Caulobacteraceae bacterium]
MRVVWTRPAQADLLALLRHIAEDSYANAVSVDERIHAAADRLEQLPKRGRLGSIAGTRELVVPRTSCHLVYRVGAERVEILRVIHGARDWP